MLEFFNHHSQLTAEADVVKKDGRYFNLSDLLTEQTARHILLLLMENRRSREVVQKMQQAGITGTIAIVRKFKACNWDRLDRIPDISDDNALNFEYVECGHKGANRRCPHSTPLDTKPYCIIKTLLNVPNYADCTGTKRNGRRIS